ncbi:Spo12 family protein [Coccidioides immitis RS]|uniref:Spo12 family protein n=4 Tax=Coccidioides immitis TaxID=5501 RepID=A0A0D8JT20_COCIM|nr:Spo12 family protein [Coccidioides immitis RS]KJF60500.1 Spo12 family protein [Coccidioides immitis RS]KMP03094.1 hypothetical protein CIRG_02786 [Coccidioides immitis RMSCC 2394]KMU76195.1 hypothetical protein CISG_05563 [Coccidioides immitis RMSCC 3703]KMU84666.1 hypothetical protein CIHG_02452 [Coccidioides immitis H538.4]
MTTNATSPSRPFPLSDRSTNTFLPSPSKDTTKVSGDCEADTKAAATKSMEYHRQVLKEKLEGGALKAPEYYVSPSDDIMSPCTKKICDLKGKKFKNAKPQVLFAKAIAKKSYEKMSSEKPGNDGADA